MSDVRRPAETGESDSRASTRHWWARDLVAVALVAVVAAMSAFVVYAFQSTGRIENAVERLGSEEHELFDLAWQIRFYDQELTLAASRYIDGDADERAAWAQVYEDSAAALDEALAGSAAIAGGAHVTHLQQVSDANDALIALETRIFELSDAGETDEARALLSGEYAIQKAIYQQGIDAHFLAQEESISSEIDTVVLESRASKIVASGALGLITVFVAFIARINHQQKLQARRRNAERDQFAARQMREANIRDGFEMALTEEDALATFEAAMRQELDGWHTELLLADSSTAHLHRAASTHREGEPACCVATPTDCPAIRRATTLTFTHSDRYNSCPNLRGRDLDGGTAVCVPLKVMGKSIGIAHSLAPGAVDASDLERMGEIVQTGGDRLGVLRAFATTRKQAARDPLTGLHNRRSAEEEARDLDAAGGPYSVAFCDLDRFKELNDTHGHGTGDRALRLFAQILTTTLRPSDITARWGGEEFVIIFPATEAGEAVDALERVREALALALLDASIPRFTFSAGVTISEGDFAAATAEADASLLDAKRLSRDRIVRADDRSEDESAVETPVRT